jgi:hypothetical protein
MDFNLQAMQQKAQPKIQLKISNSNQKQGAAVKSHLVQFS